MLHSLAIGALLCAWIVVGFVSGAEEHGEESFFSGWDEFSWPGSFLLFGRILLPPKRTSSEGNCELWLSVKIGKKVWEQPVDSTYYAFHAPPNIFSGMVGTLAVLLRSHQQLWEPLWSQAFMIQGSSSSEVNFLELQADLSTALPLMDKCFRGADAVSIGDDHVKLSTSETRISLPFSRSEDSRKAFCTAPDWHANTCPTGAEYGIASAKDSCIPGTALSTVSNPGVADESAFSQPFPANTAPPFSSLLHLRGGTSFSWLLHFIFLSCTFYLVKSMCSHPVQNLDLVSDERHSGEAPWQLRVCCPSSDGTVRGQSCRARNTLVQSGRGCFRDAWEAAELHLSESENCCFYYNCVSQTSTPAKQALQPGRWNRDKTGRLSKTAD